jgi:hypothetical protein
LDRQCQLFQVRVASKLSYSLHCSYPSSWPLKSQSQAIVGTHQKGHIGIPVLFCCALHECDGSHSGQRGRGVTRRSHITCRIMAHIATMHSNRVTMQRWIAAAVLLTQLMAGVCVLDASVNPRNSCCGHCDSAAGMKPGTCCRLDTPSIPSLAASAPFEVTPPTIVAAPAVFAETLSVPGPVNRAGRSDLPSASLSPPKLYVLHESFLI